MHRLLDDLRLCARRWRKDPGWVLVALATLALGLGANTTLYTLVDAILIKGLPVTRADELVVIRKFDVEAGANTSFSYPMYADLRDRTHALAGVFAVRGMEFNAATVQASERIAGEMVSGNYFGVLGVASTAGRLLSREDDVTPGAHPVVVIGHGYWQRRFGSDAQALGATLTLNGRPLTIVGIAPPGFYGVEMSRHVEVWIPMSMAEVFLEPAGRLASRRHQWLNIVARENPGVPRAQAQAEVGALHAALRRTETAARTPRSDDGERIELVSAQHGLGYLQRTARTPLTVLLVATGLVLLVACANLAGLLLARGVALERDVAIRKALGARHAQIVRHFLTESLALSLLGGGLGLGLAHWLIGPLLAFLPSAAVLGPRIAPDHRVFAFALALSVVTGIVFGVGPAWRAGRGGVAPLLKAGGPASSSGRSVVGLRGALVVAQIAFSVLLLSGAGLFLRTLGNVLAVDRGFDTSGVMLASVAPAANGYSKERTLAIYEELLAGVRALPGVRAAGLSTVTPMSGAWDQNGMIVEGHVEESRARPGPHVAAISTGLLEALGIQITAGRAFSERDQAHAARVAVINEAMARYFFGGPQAVGRRIGFAGDDEALDIEIVGVVRDSRYVDLREETPHFVYLPVSQAPEFSTAMTLAVATSNAAALPPALRALAADVDPGAPFFDIKTLASQVAGSVARERLLATLTTAFAALATVLAAIGLYGALAFATARAAREIGIRVALGAEPRQAALLVVRGSALLLCVGLAVGAAGAAGLARLIEGLLYGVRPADPLVLALVCVCLIATGLVASYGPARRAARADPQVVLRAE